MTQSYVETAHSLTLQGALPWCMCDQTNTDSKNFLLCNDRVRT